MIDIEDEVTLDQRRRQATNINQTLNQFIGGTLETIIGNDIWRGTIVDFLTNVSKNTTTISEKDIHKLDRDIGTFSIKQGTSSSIFSTTVLLSGTFIFENQYIAQDGPNKTFVFTKKGSEATETTKKTKFRSIDEPNGTE